MDVQHQNKTYFAGPRGDPVAALAPIRRLVLAAMISGVLAVGVLVSTAFHVMDTHNEATLSAERLRVARIADVLESEAAADLSETVAQLGRIAGIDTLVLTGPEDIAEGAQVVPLPGGPARGMVLSWMTEPMGTALFQRFAPTRLPFVAAMVASVLVWLLLIMRHVRRLEQQRLDAERQAQLDHLTGLPNRLALERQLARLTEAGRSFSVLAMDLDQFKPINDAYGHDAGDMALIAVARRLTSRLRAGDLLARVGGDEFVAIVQCGGQRDALGILASDLIGVVSAPLVLADGHEVQVGVSIGIVADGSDENMDEPLKRADRALYEAKREKNGGYCFAEAGRDRRRAEDWPVSSFRISA